MITCSCCGNVLRVFGVAVRDHRVILRQGAHGPLHICGRHGKGDDDSYIVHHGDGMAWMMILDIQQAKLFRFLDDVFGIHGVDP